MRDTSRRDFLIGSARLGAAGALAATLPVFPAVPAAAVSSDPVFFTPEEWTTLQAAVAQIVPAEFPGDWSAITAGAHCYIDKLLSTFDDDGQPVAPDIFAGGPKRADFPNFQELSRVKLLGWGKEVARLRGVYREGLADLDVRAGGTFASAPGVLQEGILLTMDLEKAPLFEALYEHTMEGVYGHPVYGGNTDFHSWKENCYQGDVHGIRFPDQLNPPGTVSDGAWNVHGGYAPEEMIQPGVCPGQGPVES